MRFTERFTESEVVSDGSVLIRLETNWNSPLQNSDYVNHPMASTVLLLVLALSIANDFLSIRRDFCKIRIPPFYC